MVFRCCCIGQSNLQSAGIYQAVLDRIQSYLTNSTCRQLEGFFFDFTVQGSQAEFGDQLAYQFRSLDAVGTVRQFESNIAGYISENVRQSQTITLEAKEDSLAWYGSVQVKVYNTTLDLANIIKVTNLGNLTYVDEGDGTKTSARLLTYPLDFSTYAPGLQAITGNEVNIDASLAGNLTTLIKEQTGVSDDIINELKTNLQTATFVYNGATTASTDKGVNATYNHVLVLSLADGTHTYGKAVFGYNVSE